jgi:hypothetical protein
VSDGEIKATFEQGLATSVYLSTWGKTNVRVCYAPESKSNRTDKSTNLEVDDNGALQLGCANRDSGNCVQCFQ